MCASLILADFVKWHYFMFPLAMPEVPFSSPLQTYSIDLDQVKNWNYDVYHFNLYFSYIKWAWAYFSMFKNHLYFILCPLITFDLSSLRLSVLVISTNFLYVIKKKKSSALSVIYIAVSSFPICHLTFDVFRGQGFVLLLCFWWAEIFCFSVVDFTHLFFCGFCVIDRKVFLTMRYKSYSMFYSKTFMDLKKFYI